MLERNKKALTRRELAVLIWLARGFSHKETARKLEIGLGTVGTHSKQILRKLKAKNMAHACARAALKGIVKARHLALREPVVRTYRNPQLGSLHEIAKSALAAGAISEAQMQEFNDACLTEGEESAC